MTVSGERELPGGSSDEPGAVEAANIRVSDAEREHAANLLQRAVGQGRITVVEFDERLGAAMAARTRGELSAVLSDLPDAALPALAPALHKDVVQLGSGVGDVTKRGYWAVPRLIRVTGTIGDAVLDFTEAEFSTSVITIEVSKGVGDLVLVVPTDITVDADEVRLGVGDVKDRTAVRPADRTRHIVVRGNLGMGDVKIMHPRAWRFGPWLVHQPFRITRYR